MTMNVDALKALEPGDKLLAGNAVHLRCNADGSITVTLRVKRDGKQKDIKAGVVVPPFTKSTLTKIRALADAQRGSVADKVLAYREAVKTAAPEPTDVVKLKETATLGDVWDSYRAAVVQAGRWSERNLKTNDDRVAKHLVRWAMWDNPVRELDSSDIAHHLAKLAKTPAQQKKVRGLLSLMLTHAKAKKLIAANPVPDAVEELTNVSAKAKAGRHHHALMDVAELRKLYKTIGNLSGSVHVRNALRLQMLTAQRTGEIISLQWRNVHLDETPRLVIDRANMKMKLRDHDHVVYLSAQAVELLQGMRDAAGDVKPTDYLFPGRPGEDRRVGHITDNAISQAMRRDLKMDGLHVPHGTRASMKTLATRATDADERPLFAAQWIETVLDHQSGDAVEQAYNRGKHFAQAGKVLAWWGAELTA